MSIASSGGTERNMAVFVFTTVVSLGADGCELMRHYYSIPVSRLYCLLLKINISNRKKDRFQL
jgi:hypothetical protein